MAGDEARKALCADCDCESCVNDSAVRDADDEEDLDHDGLFCARASDDDGPSRASNSLSAGQLEFAVSCDHRRSDPNSTSRTALAPWVEAAVAAAVAPNNSRLDCAALGCGPFSFGTTQHTADGPTSPNNERPPSREDDGASLRRRTG